MRLWKKSACLTSGNSFKAFEAPEAAWLKAMGRRKIFLHGLIQVAAAFHHHTRRNPNGLRSVPENKYTKLKRFGEEPKV
jgi:hypothetical protein